MHLTRLSATIIFTLLGMFSALACTSMIISGSATASGRPLLWKHRDTAAESNFIHRVDLPGKIGYVGLFNGGDSLVLDEVWMGMNDAGFAIMNTVAYNLPENDPDWADREGFVMAHALQTCRTVNDFEKMLRMLPRPMGVRTNFGVIDAEGNGAYFETDDYNYKRYDLSDARESVMIRTNYAYSGTPNTGKGYVRHQNVIDLLSPQIRTGSITPASLTEGISRSFYNADKGFDFIETSDSRTIDIDFVPRYSSTASIVIEGLLSDENPDNQIMWANIAYPPCCHIVAVRLDDVPAEIDATAPDGSARAPLAIEAAEVKALVFSGKESDGNRYVNLDILRPVSEEEYQKSLEAYSSVRR